MNLEHINELLDEWVASLKRELAAWEFSGDVDTKVCVPASEAVEREQAIQREMERAVIMALRPEVEDLLQRHLDRVNSAPRND